MSNKTLTRADLTEKIYEELGLSRSESATLVESVLDEVLVEVLDNLEVATAGSCSDGDAQSRHIQGLLRRMGQFSLASQ